MVDCVICSESKCHKGGIINMSEDLKFNAMKAKSKHTKVKKSPNGKMGNRSPLKVSPILKPIVNGVDQYLQDLSNSSFASESSVFGTRSETSISHFTELDRWSRAFSSRAKTHYQYMVKLLPILIIFLPSLLNIFFPKIIRFGKLEIGDHKNNPSNILIDFFSILLICWIIKFLLDWPWKWYAQINEIKQKLYTLLESTKDDQLDFKKITNQNLTILKLQQFCALILCVGSPFLSGLLLFFARDYIIVIGNEDGNDQSLIFSDLNIGIFVSCGIIRVVIQISEHIQQSTASIESKTEKFIAEHNHFNSLDIELRHQELNQNVQLMDRVTILERQINQMNQMSKNFEIFYNNNKLIVENNLTLLTSKHFKILEKEINELHYNLHTKTNELNSKIHAFITTPDNEKENQLESSPLSPQIQQQPSHSSLHGIPLSPKSPSYHVPTPSSTFPFEQYSKLTQQLPSPLSKIGSLFPILNPNQYENELTDRDAEITMKELSNIDALNKTNLGSRPIVEYVINIPFAFKSFSWYIISYIPINVLKVTYFIMLGVLDVLVSKTKDDQGFNATHEYFEDNRD